MVHKVWLLLGVHVTVATVTIRAAVIPDVSIVVTIVVAVRCEGRQLRVDVSWNVCGMCLWLISSRVLIEHGPIIVSRCSTSRTHVLGGIKTRVGCRWRSKVWCRI